jgi:polygalacturonase
MIHDITHHGAVANGRTICTAAFSAAIAACREAGGGTVFVPAGEYLTGPIHLCSNLTLELEAGAKVRFTDDFDAYPIVPSRWGGNMVNAFSPLIYGVDLENVEIRGRGEFDGQGRAWWDEYFQVAKADITAPYDDRTRAIAAANPGYEKLGSGGGGMETQFLRPPLLQLLRCKHVRIEGVTLGHSPFWNTHLALCDDVTVTGVRFVNPKGSANGDGLDIDSSSNVRVSDCYFNTGDDCLALKSGADADGRRVGRPTENVTITNCTMVGGHGGIVIGSETAGGIRRVVASNCIFEGVERGISVKSRRGRGGVVEDFRATNIIMLGVGCPVTLTSYYWCGTTPERHAYIASPEPQAVTEETPILRNFQFSHLTCRGARWAAGVFQGLPEAPIENLVLDDVIVEMAPEAEPGLAEGGWGLPYPVSGVGIYASHVQGGLLRAVKVTGAREFDEMCVLEPELANLIRQRAVPSLPAEGYRLPRPAVNAEYSPALALTKSADLRVVW